MNPATSTTDAAGQTTVTEHPDGRIDVLDAAGQRVGWTSRTQLANPAGLWTAYWLDPHDQTVKTASGATAEAAAKLLNNSLHKGD